MSFDANTVKELRERTGAGIMNCKKALLETEGNMEKAIEYLRQKGLAAAAKKSQRVAREGVVDAYVHAGGRIGVLVELNCETDFVGRTDEFKELAHELAMQVAALNPLYVSREDVPEDAVEKEREILKAQAKEEGKPDKILDKIVDGRISKFFESTCLLEQPYIRDQSIKIQDLINQAIAKVGENIVVRRFVRFEVGEEKDSGEAQV
jgi:elongation factor Ts